LFFKEENVLTELTPSPPKLPKKRKDAFLQAHSLIFKATFMAFAIYEFVKFLKVLWLTL